MAEIRYGEFKQIEKITAEDMGKHPIWLWCMGLGLEDEDDGPVGGDETAMRLLLNSRNVDGSMSQPLILLRVKGKDYTAAGLYDNEGRKVISIGIHKKEDELTKITRVGGLRVPEQWSAPITLVAVPTIEGKAEVEFVCESLDVDEGKKVEVV